MAIPRTTINVKFRPKSLVVWVRMVGLWIAAFVILFTNTQGTECVRNRYINRIISTGTLFLANYLLASIMVVFSLVTEVTTDVTTNHLAVTRRVLTMVALIAVGTAFIFALMVIVIVSAQSSSWGDLSPWIMVLVAAVLIPVVTGIRLGVPWGPIVVGRGLLYQQPLLGVLVRDVTRARPRYCAVIHCPTLTQPHSSRTGHGHGRLEWVVDTVVWICP